MRVGSFLIAHLVFFVERIWEEKGGKGGVGGFGVVSCRLYVLCYIYTYIYLSIYMGNGEEID